MKQKIPAVVIGSCSHALAICRSLGRKGVPTFLLQEKRNMPVSKTRYAKSVYVSAINTDELIPNLIKISDRFSEKPVLFPTNDNMVRLIALHYEGSKYSVLFFIVISICCKINFTPNTNSCFFEY